VRFFHPDLAGARDGAEILTLLPDKAQHFGRRCEARRGAKITDAGCNSLITQGLIDRAIQLLDDVIWRSLGRHEGIPSDPFACIQTKLHHGGHAG